LEKALDNTGIQAIDGIQLVHPFSKAFEPGKLAL
jgi:hypothetical protein